ncbi:glycosyltransferase family 4 protein [Mucilaginibacter sp. PPCGB 2223]|uniref:glycosyltransferase family 4 protein n=1 Tax=Mucilaginibacter sp. PPCGB 2223 TaxID=1886027 RepID=UPI00158613FE|nr:glycosyltransferase family 4 protein [Mucilaginibacter sp. PPCGB 2223]
MENNIELHFILINDDVSDMELFLQDLNVPVTRVKYKGKAQALVLLYKLYLQLHHIKPDIVHTHLRQADILGQMAAYLSRIKKRIYTRHSSTLNHVFHKKAVLADKMVNFLATDIIAISDVTRQVLIKMEGVNEAKVTLIHHGFDLAAFDNVDAERVTLLRNKYGFRNDHRIVGVIARYTKFKGHEYIIPALAKLKEKFPDLHFVFANTAGEYATTVRQLLTEYLPRDSYTEISFEADIQALYKLLDIYIHVPIDDKLEAFGQTYVEALASGVPSVFTLSGIGNEFITDEENALVVGYKNTAQIYNAAYRLLTDEDLRKRLIINGKTSVQQFDLASFINKTIQLYES